MIKNLFKRMLGIDKLEENLRILKELETKAVASTAKAQKAEEQAKASPKERATARGEPYVACLLYTSPSPRDRQKSRMPSSA